MATMNMARIRRRYSSNSNCDEFLPKPPSLSPNSNVPSKSTIHLLQDMTNNANHQNKRNKNKDIISKPVSKKNQRAEEDQPFDCINSSLTYSPSSPDEIPSLPISPEQPKSMLEEDNDEGIAKRIRKSTSYRMRRMQITQQRKWNDERMERALNSPIDVGAPPLSPRTAEQDMNSPSVHHGKKRLHYHKSSQSPRSRNSMNRSYRNTAYSQINNNSNEEDDASLGQSTLATTSSLNSSINNNNDVIIGGVNDTFSSTWLPPKLTQGDADSEGSNGKKKKNMNQILLVHHHYPEMEVHPPLYVSSKTKIEKEANKNKTEEGEYALLSRNEEKKGNYNNENQLQEQDEAYITATTNKAQHKEKDEIIRTDTDISPVQGRRQNASPSKENDIPFDMIAYQNHQDSPGSRSGSRNERKKENYHNENKLHEQQDEAYIATINKAQHKKYDEILKADTDLAPIQGQPQNTSPSEENDIPFDMITCENHQGSPGSDSRSRHRPANTTENKLERLPFTTYQNYQGSPGSRSGSRSRHCHAISTETKLDRVPSKKALVHKSTESVKSMRQRRIQRYFSNSNVEKTLRNDAVASDNGNSMESMTHINQTSMIGKPQQLLHPYAQSPVAHHHNGVQGMHVTINNDETPQIRNSTFNRRNHREDDYDNERTLGASSFSHERDVIPKRISFSKPTNNSTLTTDNSNEKNNHDKKDEMKLSPTQISSSGVLKQSSFSSTKTETSEPNVYLCQKINTQQEELKSITSRRSGRSERKDQISIISRLSNGDDGPSLTSNSTNRMHYNNPTKNDDYNNPPPTSSTNNNINTASFLTSLAQQDLALKKNQRKLRMLHHALTCTHPPPPITSSTSSRIWEKKSIDNDGMSEEEEQYEYCRELQHCYALGKLIRHVQTCTFRPPTVEDDGSAGTRGSSSTISHMTGGGPFNPNSLQMICDVPGCAIWKKVWNHYRRCTLLTFTNQSQERRPCVLCGDLWKTKSTTCISIVSSVSGSSTSRDTNPESLSGTRSKEDNEPSNKYDLMRASE